MVDNMDLNLSSLSYDELLELYQEEDSFIQYLEDLLKQVKDEGDE
jgi:hypothetical protein